MNRKNLLTVALVLALAATLYWKFVDLSAPLDLDLVSSEDNTRNIALARLAKLDDKERAELTPFLLNHLLETNPETRRFALYSLRKINVKSDAIYKAYENLLSDSDERVRSEAAIALMESGEGAMPHVVRAFAEGTSDAREQAVQIIKKRAAAGKLPVDTISGLLKHSELEARLDAALIISSIEPQTRECVPVYIEAVQAERWTQPTFEGLANLARIDPPAKEAIAVLNEELKKRKDDFSGGLSERGAVARALEKMDPRKTELVDMDWDLKHRNPLIRYRAAYVLSEAAPPSDAAMPLFVRALSDADPFVIARSVYGLSRIGIEKAERLSSKAYPLLLASRKKVDDQKHAAGFQQMVSVEIEKLQKVVKPKR